MPFQIVSIWLSGLVSLSLLGGGVYCARQWYLRCWGWDPAAHVSTFGFEPGANVATGYALAAVALLLWTFAGRFVVRAIVGRRPAPGQDEPRAERTGAVHAIRRADGTEIHVETYGPPDAPPIVFTHGWGADATEWYAAKRDLAGRFRLILWDLPGLGRSQPRADRDFHLEAMARDLDAVLGFAGGRPAVLVGHSIGGMIILTYCKLFGPGLAARVAGLVLTHTTPQNPVRTTKGAGIYTALEKPLLVPLMHATIWLSPLVRVMNCLSYLNGSAHLSVRRSGFSAAATRGQIEFFARYYPRAAPGILARGMLGMIRYHALDALPAIDVPALVVAGDLDPTTLPSASERIRAGIPASRLVALRPAKHLGLVEHDRAYTTLLARFASAPTESLAALGAGAPADPSRAGGDDGSYAASPIRAV